MRYQLAIFDFDGTLADTFPWLLGHLPRTAARFRFRCPPPEEVEQLRGLGAREILHALRIPFWKVPLVARSLKLQLGRESGLIRLFPGIPEALQALARHGTALAVCSSNSERNVRAILGPKVAAAFEHYACGVGLFGKTGRYKALLKRRRLQVREAISIGDELRDLDAAHAMALDFGAVGWGFTQPAALKARQPALFFESAAEMISKLVKT